MAKKYPIKSNRRRQFLLLTCAGVIILGVGSWILFKNYQSSIPESKPHYPADVVSYSTAAPDEKPPDQGYIPAAIGDDPAVLRMPSINISAPLQKVGTDQHGEIAVPNNIHLAGWFIDSAKPGRSGLSIIDGHLNGIRDEGIFSRLATISAGDSFTIERGDKQVLNFKVVSVQTVKVADAATILFSQDPTIPSQLNLITCGGTFNRESRSYDDRVIVSSRFIGFESQ